jgi:hypothetical protein
VHEELKTLIVGLLGPVEVTLVERQLSYPGQCRARTSGDTRPSIASVSSSQRLPSL